MSLLASRQNQFSKFSQILDYLYLSGAGGVKQENIKANKIKLIINTTVEVPDFNFKDVENFTIPLRDASDEDMLQHLDTFTSKIEEAHSQGKHVLVHCFAGCSRSATVVIAYLMRFKQMSLRDAYNHVKRRRPIIRPNNGFFQQLILYEKDIVGRNTVSMVPVKTPSGTVFTLPDILFQDDEPFPF